MMTFLVDCRFPFLPIGRGDKKRRVQGTCHVIERRGLVISREYISHPGNMHIIWQRDSSAATSRGLDDVAIPYGYLDGC
jgi:hypothetical protein